MIDTTNSTELSVIKISETEINGETFSGVDARELHKSIENGARFNDWIGRKIDDFGFVEGEDFYSILSKSAGGRPATEYTITLDMAKELCMLERSEIGRSVRKYFIECEKKLYKAYSLTPSQEVNIGKQLYTLVNDLEKTDSEYRKQFCINRIDRLSLILKQDMPSIDLLGKKAETD